MVETICKMFSSPNTASLLAVVAVITALWAGRTAYRTLVGSISPTIYCYLRPRPSSHVFDFVIANHGRGVAYNVTFAIEADEVDFKTHSVMMNVRKSPVPFPALEPDGIITSLFGTSPFLLGEARDPLAPFSVEVQYEWKAWWMWRQRTEKRTFNLDARAYRGLIPQWEENEVAKALKDGFKRLTAAYAVTSRQRIQAETIVTDRTKLERIESSMPELFSEMRTHLRSHPLKRHFILKPKGASYNADNHVPLTYTYDEHKDLADKVWYLARHGVVVDITYNSVERYLITEALAEYLGETESPSLETSVASE